MSVNLCIFQRHLLKTILKRDIKQKRFENKQRKLFKKNYSVDQTNQKDALQHRILVFIIFIMPPSVVIMCAHVHTQAVFLSHTHTYYLLIAPTSNLKNIFNLFPIKSHASYRRARIMNKCCSFYLRNRKL